MADWKKRAGITVASGIAAAIAFSLPVWPSSWAKPPAVKVMADSVRHQMESEFKKGKDSNVQFEQEGKQAVLSVGEQSGSAVYTSPTIESDIVFNYVGLQWKDRSVFKSKKFIPEKEIHFELRYSMDGQTWSDWVEVHADSDMGAEHVKNTDTFSNLIFADKAKYLQYRVTLTKSKRILPRIKDIKVAFINSRDGERVEKKESLWDLITAWVDAADDKPYVVSRAEWGADESLRFDSNGKEKWPREYYRVTHLFVHHTATQNNDPDPKARMRAIYYDHAVRRGWGDFGYNVVVGSDGKLYEGRKGLDGDVLTAGVVGAGTYGFNKGGFSISNMGDYQTTQLPAHMKAKLVEMLAYQAKIWNIDPLGKSDFVRDYEVKDPNIPKVDYNVNNISGHRDSKYTPGTECPGDYIYNDLPNIRQAVATAIQGTVSGSELKRMNGANRFEVSANISKELSDRGFTSDTVVIARGDLYTDALSGGPLATQSKSPILLTATSSLPTPIQDEIKRRQPAKAIILGGTGSVSTNVETQLQSLGVTNIERIDGPNRFAVSASVAEKVAAGGTTNTAIIASGLNFPDALSASSVAGQKGYPILLVGTSSIPDQIKTFIANHPEITNYVIVGGPATVSDTVKTELEGMGKAVTRISGANRFEVGVNLVKHFNMSASSLVFARGDVFADALSGGPLAALTGSPILLTPSYSLNSSVGAFLTEKSAEFQTGYILGGFASVTQDLKWKITRY
jgi:putative cell wall-binding protein